MLAPKNPLSIEIYRSIISDVNTFHILDRRFAPRSTLQNTHTILNLIDCFVDFILERNIENLIILSAPHGLYQWILARCIEIIRETKIIYFNLTLTPWRVCAVQGITEKEPLEIGNDDPLDNNLWADFCSFKSNRNIDVMPKYEKNNQSSNEFSLLLNLFKRNLTRFDKIFNAYYARFIYQRLSKKDLPKNIT